MIRRLGCLTGAAIVFAIIAALQARDAHAGCKITQSGSIQECKAIVTRDRPGERELVRFPTGSKDPTYIVLIDWLPAVPPECTDEERDDRNGSCDPYDMCMLIIDVNPKKLPLLDPNWAPAGEELQGEFRLFAASNEELPGSLVPLGYFLQLTVLNGETLRVENAAVRMNGKQCWAAAHARYAGGLARFFQ
jgi:hypothetical protein